MFKNKNVLVIGLGISGVAAIKGLIKSGANVYAYDSSSREKLRDKINGFADNVNFYFDNEYIDLNNIDIAIKSPGIKYEIPIIQRLIEKNIKVISDLEAAYLIADSKIVSITGTNGKTTTTTLIGEIINKSGKKYKLTGNIGSGIFNDALTDKETILVAEVSSFQLAGTYKYKPYVSVLTNITPDHLDWHKTLDNYIESKFKNVINQDENDFAILNYEDKLIREYSDNIKAKKIFFSADRVLDEGIFADKGKIFYKRGNSLTYILDSEEIFIPGKHNVENALAAAGACLALNIDTGVIAATLKTFKGVEHRLEYSGEYRGVKFYNDSKGTNPDASIKALEGIKSPIILIAGGYDKKSQYDEFIRSFNNKVKALILMGQTADDIEKCAVNYGFNNIYKVNNMDEAVKMSFDLSSSGDNVLLSPACASWGMYSNYEVRGRDFKERVKYYGGSKEKQEDY